MVHAEHRCNRDKTQVRHRLNTDMTQVNHKFVLRSPKTTWAHLHNVDCDQLLVLLKFSFYLLLLKLHPLHFLDRFVVCNCCTEGACWLTDPDLHGLRPFRLEIKSSMTFFHFDWRSKVPWPFSISAAGDQKLHNLSPFWLEIKGSMAFFPPLTRDQKLNASLHSEWRSKVTWSFPFPLEIKSFMINDN